MALSARKDVLARRQVELPDTPPAAFPWTAQVPPSTTEPARFRIEQDSVGLDVPKICQLELG